MSLDFQSIREQVKQLGDTAVLRERELQGKKKLAIELLEKNADNLGELRQKVGEVVRNYDASLRCALPVEEAMTASFPLPNLPPGLTIIAADGSQINPDRNAEVNYAVVNVGAIQMSSDSGAPPRTVTKSQLMFDEQLYTPSGRRSEASLALKRDLNERQVLAELAEEFSHLVVTFTDGPMELWEGIGGDSAEREEFQESLIQYREALESLHEQGVITAGYVDKPGSNLVVRLLEVLMTPQAELPEIKKLRHLRGVTDATLYGEILAAGERSPVFAIQSQSANSYPGPISLHFFYLNVGREGDPYLARVEVPAWVVADQSMLDTLHASLVSQCRLMGVRPYPYLLHRAHETAVVKLPEKEQVTAMIVQELRRRGVQVGEISSKQFAKQGQGRTRING
ncbi:MAG: DNA double-strand break repair nuclease NurA [Chloroflexota bacterium]|nr:MAG: DNA double-strand break repair nuclease NurA [Chloroflexota bacterium]